MFGQLLFGNLLFVPIAYKDFIPGKNYLIKEHGMFNTINIRGKYAGYNINYYQRWEKREFISIEITNHTGSCMCHYTLISNVQQQMETRAINMILRKVIGDDTFTY